MFDDHITWRQQGFAFAEGWDETELRYVGIHLPNHEATIHISDDTLVVKPDIAETQHLRDVEQFSDPEPQPETDPEHRRTAPAPAPGSPTKSVNRRYFGAVALDPNLPAKKVSEVFDEVLRHLISADNDVDIRLEISVTAPGHDGFSDRVQRTVSENADTLEFDSSEFEPE